MMHFFGGSDADEVIQEARAHRVPIALENHFSNDRFLHLSIRKHVIQADGVAGMNGLDVPRYVARRFCNLADGIDISFFNRAHATLPDHPPTSPLIFLPSRIVRPKGQLDVVRAAARLRSQGVDLAVAFAGRVESPAFFQELQREIKDLGLEAKVHFLGELNTLGLRTWYAASAVLAFPTYHHEGLGRIIVEAQAMEVPVVAYHTGGVPEGLVEGKTGFLVPTGDVAALADKIGLLLNDSQRRRAMGEAGRQFVSERYSLEALASRHEAFYLSVIQQAASRIRG
jgi:glycosyltransferase involved in cell wall biosynthesis